MERVGPEEAQRMGELARTDWSPTPGDTLRLLHEVEMLRRERDTFAARCDRLDGLLEHRRHGHGERTLA